MPPFRVLMLGATLALVIVGVALALYGPGDPAATPDPVAAEPAPIAPVQREADRPAGAPEPDVEGTVRLFRDDGS